MIAFRDFKSESISTMGGFCGSMPADSLINIETIYDSGRSYYRVWYWI